MNIDHDGQVFRISWKHVPDPEATAAFLAEHAPTGRMHSAYKGHIPLKAKNVIGMAVCNILRRRVTGEGESLIQGWETIATGYAFQHRTDKAYDKGKARRVSLRDAIGDKMTFDLRKAIWNSFNKQWPPFRTGDTAAERKATALSMELLDMQRLNQELYQKLYKPEQTT